jgi:hypothetical protein
MMRPLSLRLLSLALALCFTGCLNVQVPHAAPRKIGAAGDVGGRSTQVAAVAQNAVAQNAVAQNAVAQNAVAQNTVAQHALEPRLPSIETTARAGANHGSSRSFAGVAGESSAYRLSTSFAQDPLPTSVASPGPVSAVRANPRAAGSDVVLTDVFYGIPILQKSFFWDGNGEVDNSGIGVQWLHYLSDGVAIGPGLNATTWWTPGRDVYSAELEAQLRIHPFNDLPVFLDGSAGFQLANDQIPPGGTVWNYSFGFGFGTEWPVAEGTWLQAGAFYHHISNALGRMNDRNPSQNEARIWIGIAFDL